MKTAIRQTIVFLLVFTMVVTLIPNLGGSGKGYAAESLSGEVYTSDLAGETDYTLSGNTTLHVDAELTVYQINIGNYDLTIEGDGEHTLKFDRISGYQGDLIIKSGKLESNYGAGSGNWPADIDLTVGEFNMSGGELLIDFFCQSATANVSYGINAGGGFTMTGGTAEIYCLADESGSAVGISTLDFDMRGGTLSATGETSVSGEVGDGIAASGSTSDAHFYMEGGEVTAKGIDPVGDNSHGINWTADRTKNTMVIGGGKVAASGGRHGIMTWTFLEISGGAELMVGSDTNTALCSDGGNIAISGAGTRVFALTDFGTCAIEANTRDGYGGAIVISSPVKVIDPEDGYVDKIGSDSQTVYGSGGDVAQYVLIEGECIPTEIAITYDATKAFPTTRLSGHDVSLHLLRSVTSNPGNSKDGDGWLVYGADPDKTDFETSEYTCLVKKDGDNYIKLYESDEKLNATDEYYFVFNIEDDETKPFAMNKTYTATVNGEPADKVVQRGDEDGELYVYKKVELNETAGAAWSVEVSPSGSKVTRGGTRQFTADVYAATSDAVTWSVSDNNSTGTYITPEGELLVSSGETSNYIWVTATSAVDYTISDSVGVEVVDYLPSIESVAVQAGRDPVCRDTYVTFSAVVEGSDIHDLTWDLIGSDGSSYFDAGSNSYRDLYVGTAETATELTVRATSVADPTKYGEATIQLKDKEIVTGPIAITYDVSKISLSTDKTGRQISQEFVNAITCPFDASGPEDAPNGWYVYGSRSIEYPSGYTCLVRKNGNDYIKLQESDELLSEDGEYYLWFNIEEWPDEWKFDHNMDLSELNITVNGKPVNGTGIIAKWGGDIEVYVRVSMKKGWVQEGDNWYYYNDYGTPVTGWEKISAKWYYFDESGVMKIGWLKDSGKWYYFNASGAMQTGWQKISGKWYYFASSGAMATGWQKINNVWYYFAAGGAMQTGWQKIGGKQYYFKSSGEMVANEWVKGYWWLNKDGTWTYQYKGSWKQNSKGWWFGDTSGWYAKNTTITIDSKSYTFDASGYWVK